MAGWESYPEFYSSVSHLMSTTVNFSLKQAMEAYFLFSLFTGGGGRSVGGQRRGTDACKYSDMSGFDLCMHAINKERDKEKSMEVLVWWRHWRFSSL